MDRIDRRSFVRASVAACALGSGGLRPPLARAAEPGAMTLSLAAYSFNRDLNLKKKPKPTMTLEEFIDFAAGTEAKAVELTAYFFRETTPEYLDAVKARCAAKGLAVSGAAVGNNFCVADPKQLEAQVEDVRAWIGHTARLGGKTLRIFAGTVPKGDTEAAAVARCVPAIKSVCGDAEKAGVRLAVENHGGLTGTAAQLLAILDAVDHPSAGVNLDTGNFHTPDPYADMAKVAGRAVNVQVKTEVQPGGGKKVEADLKRVVGILRAAGYRGAVALEYEAEEDSRSAVPRYLAELRKLLA